MSVNITGHASNSKGLAYVLENGDTVTFHTAFLQDDTQTTFACQLERWPALLAAQLGLNVKWMRNATQQEANAAIQENNYTIIKTEEVV